jgi:hypothetical protein
LLVRPSHVQPQFAMNQSCMGSFTSSHEQLGKIKCQFGHSNLRTWKIEGVHDWSKIESCKSFHRFLALGNLAKNYLSHWFGHPLIVV